MQDLVSTLRGELVRVLERKRKMGMERGKIKKYKNMEIEK
jgi:hypothetical protein